MGLTLEGICICFGNETTGRRRFDRGFILVAAGILKGIAR